MLRENCVFFHVEWPILAIFPQKLSLSAVFPKNIAPRFPRFFPGSSPVLPGLLQFSRIFQMFFLALSVFNQTQTKPQKSQNSEFSCWGAQKPQNTRVCCLQHETWRWYPARAHGALRAAFDVGRNYKHHPILARLTCGLVPWRLSLPFRMQHVTVCNCYKVASYARDVPVTRQISACPNIIQIFCLDRVGCLLN